MRNKYEMRNPHTIFKVASTKTSFKHTGNCPTTTAYSSTKEDMSTSLISEKLKTLTIESENTECMKSQKQPITTEAAKVDDKNVAIGFVTYKSFNCFVIAFINIKRLCIYRQYV